MARFVLSVAECASTCSFSPMRLIVEELSPGEYQLNNCELSICNKAEAQMARVSLVFTCPGDKYDPPPSLPSPMATSDSLSSSSLLDDQDESVRIAVKALGDMRNGHPSPRETQSATTPALSVASTSQPPTSLPSPTISSIGAEMYGNGGALEPEFVKRMSHLPLVNSALRAYEQGKASSRVVKVRCEVLFVWYCY
ncbi:hypothetical protein DFS33DRAFT_970370 [Desarmillaria ectypa]|nr:hypothetical protein DFS33DRAFT_970370 [Desarmillaria ectypa]